MAENIFIGVDGGGTKCKVRVENAAGELLGQARGGPSNISLSVDDSWISILGAIKDALKEGGISLTDGGYNFYVGLALAGTEDKKAVSNFLAKPYPFTKVILKSDAYAACLGAHDGKDGAIIIIGTGVIGMRVQRGNVIQVGGWGFPYSDEGGGAWLGLEVVRLTTQAHDGRLEFTPLLKAVLRKFNDDIFTLVSWAVKARSTQFGELAPLVIEYVEKEDPWALHLIKTAAHEIDRVAIAMRQRANGGAVVPYSLFGGVTPFIEPWLSAELQERLVPRKNDATKGAIFMVQQELFK
ncbi:MAG: N-acetylglucosamine kinase [Gammaproteobacteria bacterium]|nr:N-acetylglucosamine kinase [Gammaproteobacteria bacterium]